MDYKELFSRNILVKTKSNAINEYVDRAIDNDNPDLFLAQCYSLGYIMSLVSNGYNITIEKDDKVYKYPGE